MKYSLIYHPDVYGEDIKNIPANIKKRIRNAIETRLQNDPILYGKPLRQSLKGHRRLRVGDWRVIYRVEAHEVVILRIGHRKEIYNKPPRRF